MAYDVVPEAEPNQYFDRQFGVHTTKLLPGQFYVTNREEMSIVTVLGSCVSVCLRDPSTGIGGMNHFMLPDDGVGSESKVSAGGRYGVQAMELLINGILKMGGARHRLEAKVFGGGNVLGQYMATNVGQKNVDFTMRFLEQERISLLAKDVLSDHPRKIYYFPNQQGRVMVKRLNRVNNNTIINRERDYSAKLFHTRVAGAVDLFNHSKAAGSAELF